MLVSVPELRGHLKGFHAGSLEAQRRAGLEAQGKAERIGHLFATRPVTEQLQHFFADLKLLYTATRCKSGHLWASVLFGKPSFVQVPSPNQAVIHPCQQFNGDPAQYVVGNAIGTVGVMLENRRRNLMHGVITKSNNGHLEFDVYQALGNCPKYIQVRELELQLSGFQEAQKQQVKHAPRILQNSELGQEQLDFIARSDTFFIASVHKASSAESEGSLPDGFGVLHINHKGGYPGFVHADPSGKLYWGDYIGNNAFSTLGNLLLDSSAGLLFINFTTGDTLHLSGQAEVLWDETSLPGAQRTISFQTEEWVHVKGALPIKQQGPVESSPYNPTPPDAQGANEQQLRCISTKQESSNVMTYEFELPKLHAKPATFCKPGQFASFDFHEITPGTVLNRTWTISSPTEQIVQRQAFTISVKKDGLVSNWLFNNMRAGKTVRFKGTGGDFTLELANSVHHSRVLLVAGGIGITPMRVLLAQNLAKQQPVTLLYFVRGLHEAPFLEELCQAADSSNGLFNLAVSVTRPSEQDAAQRAALQQGASAAVSWHEGRITPAMVRQVCEGFMKCAVFQCGPVPMMEQISSTLEGMQVPMTQVFQESFAF